MPRAHPAAAIGRRADVVIGIDVGGTFTDAVLIEADGTVHFDKAFSTPANPANGVFAALENVATTAGMDPGTLLAACSRFAHGTTVGTNALIQRAGARVGLLMTRGFEDTVPISRGPLGKNTGIPLALAQDFIHNEKPVPLVPRTAIRGVRERVDLDGDVVEELVEADVEDAARFFREAGVESIAVCLLWSFRNPGHELRVGEILRRVVPDLPVSLSARISPVIGEYERAMTTVVNAYVAVVLGRYVRNLERRLTEGGLRYPVELMTSSGGLIFPRDVEQKAVALINGGPVGGLVAARHLGRALGYENVIAADMGGTSFDVGLIHGGSIQRGQTTYVMQGVPVQVDAAKVMTIGAGGGSIAASDGERLLVGPRSAGSDPGPACYGQGGREPTVTDALVVLGLLDPAEFFGGRRLLDRALAEAAIREHVAQPLEMSVDEAAAGIYEIVTSRMRDLIRQATVESGFDPRGFVLIAYGGASPLHAAGFAHGLGVGEVVIPASSSVFSALGCAISDASYDYAQSAPLLLDGSAAVAQTAAETFAHLEQRALEDMRSSGHDAAAVVMRHRVDARYAGQMNEVTVDVDPGREITEEVRARIRDAYETRYGPGTTLPRSPVEVMTMRVEAILPTPLDGLFRAEPVTRRTPRAPSQQRPIRLRDFGELVAGIYDGHVLVPGDEVRGPAIIHRRDTTILVPPSHVAWVDGLHNTRLELPR